MTATDYTRTAQILQVKSDMKSKMDKSQVNFSYTVSQGRNIQVQLLSRHRNVPNQDSNPLSRGLGLSQVNNLVHYQIQVQSEQITCQVSKTVMIQN